MNLISSYALKNEIIHMANKGGYVFVGDVIDSIDRAHKYNAVLIDGTPTQKKEDGKYLCTRLGLALHIMRNGFTAESVIDSPFYNGHKAWIFNKSPELEQCIERWKYQKEMAEYAKEEEANERNL